MEINMARCFVYRYHGNRKMKVFDYEFDDTHEAYLAADKYINEEIDNGNGSREEYRFHIIDK